MATAREIRRRMTSVRNIRQITPAMELIAVTRLRRAQQRVVATRPYADKMRQVLGDLVQGETTPALAEAADGVAAAEAAEAEVLHPLLQRRPVHRVGIVLLTTDRGLCGALNSNTLRTAFQFALAQQNQRRDVDYVVVGRKGLQAVQRMRAPLVAEFTRLGDYPSIGRVAPIARVAMEAFTAGRVDEVKLIYPRFVSTLRQDPTVVSLLPIEPPAPAPDGAIAATAVTAGTTAATGGHATRHSAEDYLYEPDPREVLAALLPRYVEIQVYQALLETIASEFSARMVAMRNASDNANELLNDLQLGYNKARQATITREIIEVAAGAAAGT
jgi:F-type H+-transporting ATPase subunit gamma